MGKDIVITKSMTVQDVKELLNSGEFDTVGFDDDYPDDPTIDHFVKINSSIMQIKKELEQVTLQFPPLIRYTMGEIVKIYRKSLNAMTEIVDKAEIKHGCRCVCAKGCDSCCRNLFITVNYAEAYIINHYMKHAGWSEEKINRIQEKICKQADILRAAGVTLESVTNADANPDPNNLRMMKKKIYDLKLDCVFLEDSQCLIHKVKPLDCWAFRQYATSELCDSSFGVMAAIDYGMLKNRTAGYILALMLPQLGVEKIKQVDTLPGMMNRVIKEEKDSASGHGV